MDRLIDLSTLHIDPAHKVQIRYAGRTYVGCAGDSVAATLFANGVRIFSRSHKYHRPRGLYSLDPLCANCFLEIDGVPNQPAEVLTVQEGMDIKAQSARGTPERDWMGFMDWLSPFMPAGFYYRTMHRPYRLWPKLAGLIRKAAGTGRLPPEREIKGVFDEVFPATEVCVVGGGPAGMRAALAASQSGQRVILLESRPWLGGFFDYRTRRGGLQESLHIRAAKLREEVEGDPNIRVFLRTNMIGAYADHLITAHQTMDSEAGLRQRYIEIRAKSVVVATGCTERPLLFENNDKPGVMQPGSAQRLARTYGILPGLKGVFSVGDDLGLESAADLHDLGVSVQAVADIRQDGQDQALIKALGERSIPYLPGWTARRAEGRKRLQQVRLSPINGQGERRFACDLLGASAGQTPVYGPWALAPGAELAFDKHTGFFLPQRLPENMFAAGRLYGLQDAESIEASGRLAGLQAAAACGASLEEGLEEAREACRQAAGPVRGTKLSAAPVGSGCKTFICFDEDATLKHVDQAVKLGFDRPELVKRFAAVGTGPGQNGISGHNLPLYFAQQQPEVSETASPTRLRDPLHPVLMAAYAGTKHELAKRTPAHGLQDRAGGVMERAGVWYRARYFNPQRDPYPEVRAVRSGVGLIDVSTLGKFRIFGPDAEKALQRVYVSDMSRVREDRIKYSAMCNHDGCLVDDGVVVKRGRNDYFLTTSTGRAGMTAEWIRYHTRFEDWDFHIVNLTDSLGAINLSGPKARDVLAKLTDADLSREAFPFLGLRMGSAKHSPF